MPTFTGWIEQRGDMSLVPLPESVFSQLRDQGVRRVQVYFKSHGPVFLALNSKGGEGFLYISKATLKAIDAFPQEEIEVDIRPDTSTYQAPEPPEWIEILRQDEEVKNRFEALTDGKKRSILFAINRMKSSDARIRKCMFYVDELKMGKVS